MDNKEFAARIWIRPSDEWFVGYDVAKTQHLPWTLHVRTLGTILERFETCLCLRPGASVRREKRWRRVKQSPKRELRGQPFRRRESQLPYRHVYSILLL